MLTFIPDDEFHKFNKKKQNSYKFRWNKMHEQECTNKTMSPRFSIKFSFSLVAYIYSVKGRDNDQIPHNLSM